MYLFITYTIYIMYLYRFYKVIYYFYEILMEYLFILFSLFL